MKRLLVCLVVAGLLLATAAYAAPVTLGEYRGNPIVKVVVDGVPLVSDVPPFAMDGRTLIPLSAVAGALGASVSWDQENLTVRIDKPSPPPPPPPPAQVTKVVGPDLMKKPTDAALVWIQLFAPDEYAVINKHVQSIVYGLVGEAIFNADVIVLPRSTFRSFDQSGRTEISKAALIAWVVVYYGELLKAFHEGKDVGDLAIQKAADVVAAGVAYKVANLGTTDDDRAWATVFGQEMANPANPIKVILPTDPDQTFKASGP